MRDTENRDQSKISTPVVDREIAKKALLEAKQKALEEGRYFDEVLQPLLSSGLLMLRYNVGTIIFVYNLAATIKYQSILRCPLNIFFVLSPPHRLSAISALRPVTD